MRIKTKPKKKIKMKSDSVANIAALDPKKKPAVKSTGGKVKLWCEEGEHHWHRPAQRGRKPTNCPKHAPEKPETQSNGDGMVTLHCELGDHEWERPSQRGKKPRNCPEHQPEQPEKRQRSESRIPRDETTEKVWDKVISHPNYKTCRCNIHKGMTFNDLRSVKSCKDRWICGVLDRYRRLMD